MPTYQDIKSDIAAINLKSKKLATMSREDIFDLLSEITFVNDKIADFIYELDKEIDSVSTTVIKDNPSASATALKSLIKVQTSRFESDKAWASRQSSNLKDIRISALAAQRAL